MLSRIRSNKKALFSTMGFAAGALGALLARVFSHEGDASMLALVGVTGLWVGTFSAVISMSLIWAQDIYNRRPGFPTAKLKSGLGYGFIGGLIAGSVAQTVYSFQFDSQFLQEVVFKPACWALMGAVLGWRLAGVIPNFPTQRAVTGGAIGGAIGGFGFVLVPDFFGSLPEVGAQMLGVAILGAVLGISIVTIESMFREACLEITWAPKEVTVVNLGAKQVTIGGGDDHIYVDGMPQGASGVLMEQGKIYYVDNVRKTRTELRDGSRINIGSVSAVVKAKA